MPSTTRLRFFQKQVVPAPIGEEPHVAVKRALAGQILAIANPELVGRDRAALQTGVSGPRMSDLRAGRLHRFTCDSLINMLARTGHRVDVVVTEVDVRIQGRRRRRHGPSI